MTLSDMDHGEEGSDSKGDFGIRPIVVLPCSLQVEAQSDGTYDLVE